VPSEDSFGVGPGDAYDLLLTATELGLQPYGLTFHMGWQMTRSEAGPAAEPVCGVQHTVSVD
jgi:diaminopimelate decarboxylase